MFKYEYGLLFNFGIEPQQLSTKCDYCNLLTVVVRCFDNTCQMTPKLKGGVPTSYHSDDILVGLCIVGSAAFDFTCLLHTYFRVPDVTTAAVSNLRGCTFTDKVTF